MRGQRNSGGGQLEAGHVSKELPGEGKPLEGLLEIALEGLRAPVPSCLDILLPKAIVRRLLGSSSAEAMGWE